MFKELAGQADTFTIKVGNEVSYARFNLYNPAMVQSLLLDMSAYPERNS
jgi:hypothetical protein